MHKEPENAVVLHDRACALDKILSAAGKGESVWLSPEETYAVAQHHIIPKIVEAYSRMLDEGGAGGKING